MKTTEMEQAGVYGVKRLKTGSTEIVFESPVCSKQGKKPKLQNCSVG